MISHGTLASGLGELGPPVRDIDLMPWPQSYGTDFYGALHVAAEYCGLNRLPAITPGTWQHGVAGPWEQVQPETIVCLSPRPTPCFVARRDELEYLKGAGYTRVRAIGLPVIYTKPVGTKRSAGSLLVMPTHSFSQYAIQPSFNKYVAQIAALQGKFNEVTVCVSANCIAQGYWAPQFEAAGLSVVRGAGVSDANALRRMRALFENFEYVTTDGYGSHVFYALYFGAKVSIWGESSPLRRENMLKDGTWAAFPDAVNRYLSKETMQKAEKYLGPLRVDPLLGVRDIELGGWMLGHENKLSPRELQRCFGWTPLRVMNATLRKTVRGSRLWSMGSRMKRYLTSAAAGSTENNAIE